MEATFPLEEYGIDIGGVHVGNFNGFATLERDPGYEFIVTAIELDGEGHRIIRTRIGGTRRIKSDAKIILTKDEQTAPGQFLFKALSDAIYADPHASRFWADAVESEVEAA